MNVILIDVPDQFLLDLQVVLIRAIGCNIIQKRNSESGINEIRSQKDILLIITREKMGTDEAYQAIKNEIQNSGLDIPIICRTPSTNSQIEHILDESSLDSCISKIMIIIKKRLVELNKKNIIYFPVQAEKFLSIESSKLVCDVYIKIKKNGLPDQYIKRLHAGDQLSREEVEKYIKSGLKEFYITENQYTTFINMISIELIKALKNPSFEYLDRFLLNSYAYETTIERLKIFSSIDDITIHLVNESIKATIKAVEKNDALTNYLKHLKASTASFAFFHCYLIALLSEKLAKFFEWNSPQARDKLIYLAFFHDISLDETALCEINTKEEFDTCELPTNKKDLIINHALASSELLSGFKDVPFGLSQLVKEHHGSKSGVGFPDSLSINISPIAMMFIVLEDFSSKLIKANNDSNFDIDKIFFALEPRYTKLAYLQTLTSLKSILSNTPNKLN